MALLPEELHGYNLAGFTAMSDLIVEIETRAENHACPWPFGRN